MSRSYTSRARPAQTTRPTPRMNPARGMSEEMPQEGERDVSPSRRGPVQGSSGETRENGVPQRRLPSSGSSLTPQQRYQMYRQEEKQRKEREDEEYKQKQRQKSIQNDKREEQRQKDLEADHKRKRAEWLDKLEGKSSGKKMEKPAAAAAAAASGSAASAFASEAGGDMEENDGCECEEALAELESMFPGYDKDILWSLLKDNGNDVDRVAQLLS